MNFRIIPFVLVAITLIWSACENKDVDPRQGNSFEVNPYSKVTVAGNVKVAVNENPSEASSEYLITIKSNDDQLDEITVTSEGDVLYISASNLRIEDDVIVELNNDEIYEIKLEADQTAVFEGDLGVDELQVKTEANSELTLSGIYVDRLFSKQEGESTLNLSSATSEVEGPVTYPEEDGKKLNDTTLLVNDDQYVYGDSVKFELIEEDSVWVVYGDTVDVEYEIPYCEFKTEGNTYIDAEYAKVRELNIKLEGSSEAKVWVNEILSGKGEGSSALYYKGDPNIDFITEGGAKILPI